MLSVGQEVHVVPYFDMSCERVTSLFDCTCRAERLKPLAAQSYRQSCLHRVDVKSPVRIETCTVVSTLRWPIPAEARNLIYEFDLLRSLHHSRALISATIYDRHNGIEGFFGHLAVLYAVKSSQNA